MVDNKMVPKRLYKYREFDSRILDLLVSDELYFADPTSFNDPLDTRPHLEIDCDIGELEKIARTLIEQQVTAKLRAAAISLNVSDTGITEQIARRSHRKADQVIADIDWFATGPGYGGKEVGMKELLRHRIEGELLRRYEKGIVSLAERADCMLMWSHYGGQHRGICIGYSVPEDAADHLRKVVYDESRLVAASQVSKMLAGNDTARMQVDEAILLRKAPCWKYEREWRLIGPRGASDSPLELEEIIFGTRCEDSVKYSVMKALEDRDRPAEFYELGEKFGTFDLAKEHLRPNEELSVNYPRRARSVLEEFEDLSDSPVGDAG